MSIPPDALEMAKAAMALSEKATAGPWEAQECAIVAPCTPKGLDGIFGVSDGNRPNARADARWIATARTSLPALAAALIEADAEMARLRAYKALAEEAKGLLDWDQATTRCSEWMDRFDALAKEETDADAG